MLASMKRVFDPDLPEFMDRDQPVTPELEAEMRNLTAINRQFGSHRLLRKFLDLWFNPGRCYRVLDLCTGSGDLPRVMVDWARPRDITLRIHAIDASEASLDIAKQASTGYPEISYVREDVLKFRTKDTYDLVLCSLALHHFTEGQAVHVLRRCRELSHRCVLVADLERSIVTYAAISLLTTFFYREPATRQDGLLSARRAFSFREFRELATTAGWQDFGHGRFLLCRQAIWLDQRELAEIPIEEGLPCPT